MDIRSSCFSTNANHSWITLLSSRSTMSATLSVVSVRVPLSVDRSVIIFVIVAPSVFFVENRLLLSADNWSARQKNRGGSPLVTAAPSSIRVDSYLMVLELGSEVCLLLDT